MHVTALSRAATALLRALIERAGCGPQEVELVELKSVEWQSLTFSGERHQVALKFSGLGSRDAVARLTAGLAEPEFHLPGQIVADVVVSNGPAYDLAGLSASLTIEALTVED